MSIESETMKSFMERGRERRKLRLPRIQFRLRTFLIVCGLATVPFGFLARELEQIRQERATASWIVDLGGRVTYHRAGSWPKQKLIWAQFYGAPVTDLTRLSSLRYLQMLDLDGTKVTDLWPLAGLKQLVDIRLRQAPVEDLSPLMEMKNLRHLLLRGTPVSDKQVQMLEKALPHCIIYVD